MTPSYYYDKERNEFNGPIDKVPQHSDYQWCACLDCVVLRGLIHHAPSIPHAFSGESRVVPEGEIRWKIECDAVIGCNCNLVCSFHSQSSRRVATPINESPGYTSSSAEEGFEYLDEFNSWAKSISEGKSLNGHYLYLWWKDNVKSPPSPQTGEKDEAYEVEHEEYVKELIEENHGLKIAIDKLTEALRLVREIHRQPPPAQSDQDAAEKWQTDEQAARAYADEQCGTHLENPEVRVIHNGCYTDFLRGCTHVRGQQQGDAVAFAEWATEEGYRWLPVSKVWIDERTAKYKTYTSRDLYALFTAPPPTPKPDSHE